MRRAPFLVALFLAALALRPQLVGIGPLLPAVQHDLDVTHAVAGLLGTIPVLCMGLFAPPAPFLSGRIGPRLAIGAALTLIGVFGVVRALAPGAVGVIVLTFPSASAWGLQGRCCRSPSSSASPTGRASRRRLHLRDHDRLCPRRDGRRCRSRVRPDGWRTPLLVFGAVSTVLAAVWLWLTRSELPHERVDARPLRLPFRRPLAWRLVAAFFLMSSVFYGLNAWLPDAYVERGWSESSAGGLLAVLNTVTIPVGFGVAWAADHWGRGESGSAARRRCSSSRCSASCCCRAAAGAGRCCSASSIGPLFPLTMTLPLDARRAAGRGGGARGDDARRRLHALRTSPLLLGALRDLTGGFDAVLWALVGLGAAARRRRLLVQPGAARGGGRRSGIDVDA